MAFFWAPRCSSWFPGVLGTEVDGAKEGCWRHCFTKLLYLIAKPVHVGVDVDGLACPCSILWPVAVRRGDRAYCQVLSSRISVVGLWHLSEGCEAPRLGYLVEY
jgi:hypothetical protein